MRWDKDQTRLSSVDMIGDIFPRRWVLCNKRTRVSIPSVGGAPTPSTPSPPSHLLRWRADVCRLASHGLSQFCCWSSDQEHVQLSTRFSHHVLIILIGLKLSDIMRDSSSLVIGEVAYYHFRIIIRQYHFNTIGIAQLQHDSVQYLCHGHPCNNSNNIALHSTLITSDQLTHQLFHCKPLLSSPRLQAVNLCSHAFQNNIPRLPGPTVPILP